jgi:hypothetical protein
MAAGENAVGAALDRLREHGYDVLHDVRWPGRRRANIDHVAIGPAGILVVDAENWSGVVSTHHGRLRQNGKRRDKQLEGVHRAGVDVAALLRDPWAQHVLPVLCLSGKHDVPPTRCGDVTVVDVGRVPGWVAALPQQLWTDDVLKLAEELRGKLPPASSPMLRESASRRAVRRSATPPAGVFRTDSDALRQRSARRAVLARRTLFKLTALLVLAIMLPTLVHWWSTNGGSDVMRSIFSVAPTSPDAAVVVPPPPVYDSCSALRAAHPGGVASLEAHNTGRKLRASPVVMTSATLYAANNRLDKDRDGLACEVVRNRPKQ